jgi:hypothetical protein
LNLEAYLEERLATLRTHAHNRSPNESFTPYNIAIIELELALKEIRKEKQVVKC